MDEEQKPDQTPDQNPDQTPEDTTTDQNFDAETQDNTTQNNVDTAELSGDGVKPKKSMPKKKLIIILGIVALLVIGAVVYWQMSKNDKGSNSNQTSQTSDQTTSQPTQSTGQNLPDTVPYAFATEPGSNYGIFWRPSEGGERTDAKLAYSVVYDGDVVGQNVVFVVSETFESPQAIIYSSDGGKTYKKIFEGKPANGQEFGDQITSIKISNDGTSVVFGLLPDNSTTNEVTEVRFADSTKKKLFDSSMRGVFIAGYNASNQRIVYSEGCYNCDARSNEYKLSDLKTSTKKELTKSSETSSEQVVAVNNDISEALLLADTIDNELTAESISGGYSGPPYTLSSINLSDFSRKKLASYGTKPKASSTPIVLDDTSFAGYMADGKTVYYSFNNQLFGLADPAKPSLLFEADKTLQSVYYVSDKKVIAKSGTFDNFQLTNFDIESKKITNILNGDDNTVIFGVTTK